LHEVLLEELFELVLLGAGDGRLVVISAATHRGLCTPKEYVLLAEQV
jgi:hypothetical protein